ncbi:allantoin racemase [Sedimentibacter acidaminivorans]|uniref:Allantoin racemase n=1 Tax=Sedimentibacter acidaminivorans TaxID=913099 RepID=A0ABS4GI34_9FIRM|nr:aspartate/glutamate racemase family protein [Sedimentibacter acidaminivorans]MBP1927352.1 allantoin racemase [Sedimentibacter acidaminivorans]
MKILIINPNSSLDMTDVIQKSAENFANGEYEVMTLPTEGAPKFIDTYQDQSLAAPGMLEIVKKYRDEVDAFIVACHCDPNLDLLKEITSKPVVGIGEASMKLASMLGHRFSVISTSQHSVPNKQALIRKYHLEGCLASVRYPRKEFEGCNCNEEQIYLETSKDAIREDMAEVIVLGCAGLAGLDKRIQEIVKVPVLDSVVCALIIASGLVKANYSISKIRRYALN